MLVLTTTQQAIYVVEFQDRKKKKAAVQGVPSWAVGNADAVTITPSVDGMSCVVLGVAPALGFQISCTGDADLGEGVEPVTLTDEIQVNAGKATGGTMVASAPVEVD